MNGSIYVLHIYPYWNTDISHCHNPISSVEAFVHVIFPIASARFHCCRVHSHIHSRKASKPSQDHPYEFSSIMRRIHRLRASRCPSLRYGGIHLQFARRRGLRRLGRWDEITMFYSFLPTTPKMEPPHPRTCDALSFPSVSTPVIDPMLDVVVILNLEPTFQPN